MEICIKEKNHQGCCYCCCQATVKALNGSGITSTADTTADTIAYATDHDTLDEHYLGCIKTNCQPAHKTRKVVKQVMSHVTL